MDYFLINSQWKNSITKITTTVVHAVDTDHALLITSANFKFKANAKRRLDKPIRYHKPSPEQLSNYSDRIRTYAADDQQQEQQEINVFDRLNNILLTSANESFDAKPPDIKKNRIFRNTLGTYLSKNGQQQLREAIKILGMSLAKK